MRLIHLPIVDIIGSMEGKDLKIARIRLDLSQKQLADVLGIASNTLSRYEVGDLPIPKAISGYVECLVEKMEREAND